MGNDIKRTLLLDRIILRVTIGFLLIWTSLALCSGYFYSTTIKASTTNETNNYFEINTIEDLLALTSASNADQYYLLTVDLDFANLCPDQKWNPLDVAKLNNTIFDGGGHSLNNFTIETTDEYSGIFSRNGMNIKNLFVENVVSNGKTTGGLVGLNTGKIENIHVQGNITGSNLAGGIVGKNYGQIDHCSFKGRVEASINGGFIAPNGYVPITLELKRLRDIGYTTIDFVIYVTISEIDDCYEYLFVWDINFNVLYENKKIEHGSLSKQTTPKEYSFTFSLNLVDYLLQCPESPSLLVMYSASGLVGSNEWIATNTKISIMVK